MNTITILSNSPQVTRDIGLKIGQALRGGEVILLHGELGAGKTCLSQGVIRGTKNSNDYPRSPTFSIINQHTGRLTLYHVDLYRLEKKEDIFEAGVEELINTKETMLIEWAERIAYLDIPDKMEVTIDDLGEDKREIRIVGAPAYIAEGLKGMGL